MLRSITHPNNPNTRWKDFSLAVLSALLLVLSFPYTDAWPLAWIAFVPLLIALDGKTPGQSFRIAYLSGLLFFAGTLYWFIHVTLVGCALLILLLSLYYGMFGLAVHFFRREKSVFKIFILPCAWVVLEYVRGHFLSGLVSSSVGYSQYKNIPVIQLAD